MQTELRLIDDNCRRRIGLKQSRGKIDESDKAVGKVIRLYRIIRAFLSLTYIYFFFHAVMLRLKKKFIEKRHYQPDSIDNFSVLLKALIFQFQ